MRTLLIATAITLAAFGTAAAHMDGTGQGRHRGMHHGPGMHQAMHQNMAAHHATHQVMHKAMHGTATGGVKKSQLMKELFATDQDGDRRMSRDEYAAGRRAADAGRFAAMDGDGDGFVTLDEMVAAGIR